MLSAFSNTSFKKLYLAQILALLGTGLLTIGLGLTAYEIAGGDAGKVLGIALTIKMVAYVGFSPIANALFSGASRKSVMIGADIVRFAAAGYLPFVSSVWEVYAFIFVLQLASATFTPTFQSVIPDIFESEKEYTKALSLSRLAYDIENIASPIFAGLLLLVISYHGLFGFTAFGFLASAMLVAITTISISKSDIARPFSERLVRGSRIYLATPRLRGLLLLNFCATVVGSMVIVNSVIIARSIYGGNDGDLALFLGAFGVGSMIAALSIPRLLDQLADRSVMFASGFICISLLFGMGVAIHMFGWPDRLWILLVWFAAGLGYSGILTPSGRLLRRSSHPEDRPTLFTAQFALSHACWLFAYPAAGFLGAHYGIGVTALIFALLAAASVLLAMKIWPKHTSVEVEHRHDDLPADHPHLLEHAPYNAAKTHKHVFVIDDEHKVWPTQG